jgi:Flp pilus assembly protein TadB
MNTALLSALFGTMIVTGLIALVLAARPRTPVPRPARPRPRLLTAVSGMSPRSRMILVASVAAGLLIAATTGWVAAVVIVPVAALGLPYLLAPPATAAQIRRVEAMEEWTRSLAGVLGAGVGLEQALTATLRSTPEPIRPEVTQLVARLRARWDTEAALRAFADDLDDVTGDLVAANLILAARRRNRSLAHVLQGVAESVAEDVSSRRRVEAGRAKPRGSARLVTGFSLTVLVVLAVTGDYVAPYGTPAGQVILLVLLTAYAAALLWMKQMAQGQPFPRILGPAARAGAR